MILPPFFDAFIIPLFWDKFNDVPQNPMQNPVTSKGNGISVGFKPDPC
jgi:hypothetical protein